MNDQTPPNEAVRRRALIALFRNHPDTQRNERYGWGTPALAAERRETLLQWASTLSDHQLLRMRNVGAKSLAWVRDAASEHHVHRYECACGRAAQPAPLDERYRALVEAATLTSEWLDENYPDTDVQRELNDALADLGDDSDD